MSCRNEQAGSEFSSFFPAQKHGIAMTEKQEYLRVQRKGVVVEPLNFPATKSVLWNRIAQGDPEILHLTRKRNFRLHINEKTLRLAHRHVNQTKSPLVCFLVGSISVDSREDSVDVTVDRFDPGREVVTNNGSTKVKRKVPTTVVPGDHVIPTTMIQGLSGADSSVTHTKEEFQKAFQVLFGRVTSQEPINISHFLSVKASCHSYAGDAELILNVNCSTISMATRIQATPVAAVPIIPTALARNLSGPLRMSEVQGVPKNGYITMDHTRKLLLLLESDPKAISLPLLGIWVSGIYSIHHPYIWACCLRFIHSTAIQHRVLAPPNSFLLLLYSPVKSTPEFWECKQDQGECEQQMFELYSCYENLHLEIPAGPSSSDPLCFELFPSPRGMSRSLFEQAVEMWKTTHIESKINQDGMAQSPKQEVSSSRKKHGDEDSTLVPRPSPFPHPQKAQFLFPDVAETSLSLSFDDHVLTESSYQDFTNQQILPRPQPTKQQLQTPNQGIPSQQNQHDQENDLFMLSKDKLQSLAKRRANVKQLANNHVTQNSPSREPLKQILSSNQPLEKGMSNKQPHLSRKSQTMKGIPNQKCPKPRSKPEMGINGHNVSDLNSKSNNRNPALKVGNNVCGTAGRQQMQLKPSATKGVKTDDQECNRVGRRPFTQGMMKAADQAVENCPRQQTSDKETRALPIQIDQVQGPFLETVFEGETPDGTLNKTMDETEMEYHVTRMSEMSQSPSSVPCFLAVEGKRCQDTCSDNSDGLVQIQQSHGNQRNYSDNREDSYKELVATAEDANKESLLNKTPSSGNSPQQPSRKQSNGTDKNCIDKKHKGSPPEEYVLSILPQQSNEKDCTEEVIPPDPYALLLRQEAQLRELQEQIKLLLQQQSAALPNPNTLLTPPRTPQFDAFHGNRQSPNHSPVPMVTACTNTGASLLLGTPIKPNGKKSASTSPMKEDEVNCKKRSLPSLSAESSRHNSKESHRPDLSINPEELTNQVIELDDPSQTLASSLHAVDLPSFFESRSGMTSPNPPDQTNKGGMETSFTSPVLGESASILIEEKENEQRGQSVEKDEFTDEESLAKTSNHVSLLQRNEQQFYDNLLNQVKHILSHQDQDKSDTLEQSPQVIERLANSNKPEPTREEVIEATMKELDKMKHLTLGNEEMQSSKLSLNVGQWPIHRSVSLDVISAHPQINYMSLTVDETIDEVFSEADLKYLTDHQLLELQDIRSHHKKQSLDSVVTLQEGKSILSTKESMEKGLVCDSSSLTAVDYTWNNLSMATKNYLGKYCLAPRELVRSNNSQVDQHETEAKSKHEGPNSSLASQGCSAPPCTPEPTTKNEADSQILDITRLKKLPKLF